MSDYYKNHLSADRLRQCYEIASPRVQQYLQAEIDFAKSFCTPQCKILELGCGYGRVLKELSPYCGECWGIDNSSTNIQMAQEFLSAYTNCPVAVMDAAYLGFENDTFDLVVCIQNGLSAFKIELSKLLEESIRVTKPNGMILFSTYAKQFWDHRLEWFQAQSDAKLLGPIDWEQTKNNIIVCTDGFRSSSVVPDIFIPEVNKFPVSHEMQTIDDSSLFYILRKE